MIFKTNQSKIQKGKGKGKKWLKAEFTNISVFFPSGIYTFGQSIDGVANM